jgi:plastocyanin
MTRGATSTVKLPKSYRFDPKAITVPAGTTVTWKDDFPHNVTLLDGTKESHALPIGKSATITFAEKGTSATSALHPQQMKGTVVVT